VKQTYFDSIRRIELKHARRPTEDEESPNYKRRWDGLDVLHLRKFDFLQTTRERNSTDSNHIRQTIKNKRQKLLT